MNQLYTRKSFSPLCGFIALFAIIILPRVLFAQKATRIFANASPGSGAAAYYFDMNPSDSGFNVPAGRQSIGSAPFTVMGDIAYSPFNGKLYVISSSVGSVPGSGTLYEMNPTTGARTAVASIVNPYNSFACSGVAGGFNNLSADEQGNLYIQLATGSLVSSTCRLGSSSTFSSVSSVSNLRSGIFSFPISSLGTLSTVVTPTLFTDVTAIVGGEFPSGDVIRVGEYLYSMWFSNQYAYTSGSTTGSSTNGPVTVVATYVGHNKTMVAGTSTVFGIVPGSSQFVSSTAFATVSYCDGYGMARDVEGNLYIAKTYPGGASGGVIPTNSTILRVEPPTTAISGGTGELVLHPTAPELSGAAGTWYYGLSSDFPGGPAIKVFKNTINAPGTGSIFAINISNTYRTVGTGFGTSTVTGTTSLANTATQIGNINYAPIGAKIGITETVPQGWQFSKVVAVFKDRTGTEVFRDSSNTNGWVIPDADTVYMRDLYTVEITVYNFPHPPAAQNIAATRMNNSIGATPIPSMQASSPANAIVDSFFVTTVPDPSTQGTLYYCASATSPCPVADLVAVTAGMKLTAVQSGRLLFDPLPTFVGDVSFSYNVRDANNQLSNTANYSIPVYNNPPVTSAILTILMANTNGPTALPNLVAADADGTIATYAISGVPATGGVLSYCATGTWPGCTPTTITGSVSGLTATQIATITFDPDPSFTGNYTFNYAATDNNGNISNNSSFTVPVVSSVFSGSNLAPVATNITTQAINSSAGATAIPNLLGSDPDGNVVSYTIGSAVPNTTTEGSLTFCATPPSTDCGTAVTAGLVLTPDQAATLSFDPVASFTGTATFTYVATDNAGTPLSSAPATVNIPIVNNPPVANPDRVLPILNTLTTPTLLPALTGSDYDGTIQTFNIVSVPPSTSGTLQYCATAPGVSCTALTLTTIAGALTGLNPDQAETLNFIPNSGFVGDYTFTFSTVDNNGLVSAPATYIVPSVSTAVRIGVPPVAYSFNSSPINSASTLSLPIALSGTDADGAIATYKVTSLPASNEGVLTYCVSGTLPTCTGVTLPLGTTLNATQAATLRFTPNTNYTGTATFTYNNIDNNGNLSNSATVTIPVVNNPPVAQNLSNSPIARISAATTINPLVSTDADGTIFNYTILTIPGPGEGLLEVCNPAPATACVSVTVGQVLTPAQVSQLAFTPNDTAHSPVVSFLYFSTDNTGNRSNIASANMPLSDALPLPVRLLQFTVVKQGSRNALIEWLAGEETSGIQYHLQHSTTGNNWTVIHLQNAQNAGLSERQYRYLHSNLSSGPQYYRLMITDNDHSKEYSPVRSVAIDGGSNYQISLFPNPVSDRLRIMSSDGSVLDEVQIFGNDGRLIDSYRQVSSGSEVNLKTYESGFYILKIKDRNGEWQVMKLIKK